MTSFVNKLALTLRMIRIEHSVFALPFALISALVAAGGLPSWEKLSWIIVAMVAARSGAMAFNRLIDRPFDRLNPRTERWPLALGLLSVRFVIFFILVSSALLVYAAYRLNRLAFLLSPVALVIIFFYSLTKRFTALSHWFIGLALAVAPVGAWIAVRDAFDWQPLLLSFAVLFWTAGFDLIYSCQDAGFDRDHKLHSVPSRFGIRTALLLSNLCHIVMIAALLVFGYFAELGMLYYIGTVLVAVLLLYEHSLVSPNDLSRVNEAFFAVNGLISVLLLIATSLDLFL